VRLSNFLEGIVKPKHAMECGGKQGRIKLKQALDGRPCMRGENEEVLVNYFAICDQVITEAGTSKQSLIGIYSGLMSQQFPMHANIAVGVGVRVQSPRRRDITFRFTGPEGARIFDSPPLPTNWESVENSLNTSGFATLQISLNVRALPFERPGVYTAGLYCDGELLATYPISVLPG